MSREKEEEMSLSQESRFQKDLQIFLETYLGGLVDRPPDLTYIDMNSNIYSQYRFQEQTLTVIQSPQA